MIRMFAQFFAMFSTLFTAGEKIASSLNNMAEWADESSASFKESARDERRQKQAISKAKMALITKDATAIAQKQMEEEEAHINAKRAIELES